MRVELTGNGYFVLKSDSSALSIFGCNSGQSESFACGVVTNVMVVLPSKAKCSPALLSIEGGGPEWQSLEHSSCCLVCAAAVAAAILNLLKIHLATGVRAGKID